jgi:hypothetical protein
MTVFIVSTVVLTEQKVVVEETVKRSESLSRCLDPRSMA